MTDGGPTEGSVYHLELRQFPHNVCRFNVSEAELREKLLLPWAQERWVELGERKWSPHQATLTVLRGPRIPFGQLTMGRGWRAAQRSCQEVTEELLATARAELEGGERAAAVSESPAHPAAQAGEPAVPTGERLEEDFAADSLGLELLAQLGNEPTPLRRAWELAAERNPGSSASSALALAERAVESLLRSRLVSLVRVEQRAEVAVPTDGETVALMRSAASWGDAGGAGWVGLRRI